nr:hypothetical protein [uncultured Methanospirillum sp.]
MTTQDSPAGLDIGKKVDIRVLEAVARKGDLSIILYFEEDLAKNSTYAADLKEYEKYPDDERPFIELVSFMSFQRKMSPCFEDALTTVPLMITICSNSEEYNGKPVVKGILPFLDEMDLS